MYVDRLYPAEWRVGSSVPIEKIVVRLQQLLQSHCSVILLEHEHTSHRRS